MNTLCNDDELKENYIIREIWLPNLHNNETSEVNVIYPVSPYKISEITYVQSPEINKLE